MAKFIINNLIYDTSKMENLGTVKKRFPLSVFNSTWSVERQCVLYKSKKGNHLLVYESDYGRLAGQAITEEEAKSLMLQYQYEKYATIYGTLEEA